MINKPNFGNLDSCFPCFPGALARSKQLKRQQQQQAEAVETAEESQHAAVAAATAGQKAAAARMKQKLAQLSPTKGKLQHFTGGNAACEPWCVLLDPSPMCCMHTHTFLTLKLSASHKCSYWCCVKACRNAVQGASILQTEAECRKYIVQRATYS